ncbi:MAG: dTMP kinase [Gemmatimonadetes bacterium]|nr:dTMP kinase [Gemmatimonadota bacterium]
MSVPVDATPGHFIVLEGGEGAGKTTQWDRLAAALRGLGHDVVAVREPGGTPIGDALRALLLDPASQLEARTEALLFAASRAQLVHDVIAPARARGALVLVDRFLLSTYAYQGAGRGLPLEGLRAANALATAGQAPDLTLLLTVPEPVAASRLAQRGGADRLERAGADFHARVGAAFHDALDAAWQARHPEVGPVVRIDADADLDVVTARCIAALVARWPQRFADAASAQLPQRHAPHV